MQTVGRLLQASRARVLQPPPSHLRVFSPAFQKPKTHVLLTTREAEGVQQQRKHRVGAEVIEHRGALLTHDLRDALARVVRALRGVLHELM